MGCRECAPPLRPAILRAACGLAPHRTPLVAAPRAPRLWPGPVPAAVHAAAALRDGGRSRGAARKPCIRQVPRPRVRAAAAHLRQRGPGARPCSAHRRLLPASVHGVWSRQGICNKVGKRALIACRQEHIAAEQMIDCCLRHTRKPLDEQSVVGFPRSSLLACCVALCSIATDIDTSMILAQETRPAQLLRTALQPCTRIRVRKPPQLAARKIGVAVTLVVLTKI